MAGMLQIITYLLAAYLVFKGVEIFQIALSSSRENRTVPLMIGGMAIVASILVAALAVTLQDAQAKSLSSATSSLPSY